MRLGWEPGPTVLREEASGLGSLPLCSARHLFPSESPAEHHTPGPPGPPARKSRFSAQSPRSRCLFLARDHVTPCPHTGLPSVTYPVTSSNPSHLCEVCLQSPSGLVHDSLRQSVCALSDGLGSSSFSRALLTSDDWWGQRLNLGPHTHKLSKTCSALLPEN